MKTRARALALTVLLVSACSDSPTAVPAGGLDARFNHTFGSGNVTGGSDEPGTGTRTAADSPEETTALADTTTLLSGHTFGSGN